MRTVAFHTLGCKTNQYDTQAMRELFLSQGYIEVPFSSLADVYVINTCTVTAMSDKKSRQLAGRAQRQNPTASIVLSGCFSQRLPEDAKDIAGVRLVLGNRDRAQVVTLLEQAESEQKTIIAVSDMKFEKVFEEIPVHAHERHTRAHIKIQDGCAQYCSYCIIPYVRGPIRSRKLNDIVDEAQRLASAGFLEIVLTGIHLSSYGQDLTEKISLVDVVEKLNQIPKIKRIRLGSIEPLYLDEAFISRLAQNEKLCPHFHISLQSGSNDVLSRMHRQYSTEEYAWIVDALRQHFHQVAITTDIMVGFPGETEQEHTASMQFTLDMAFSKIHVFPYSRRKGTKADQMENQVSSNVKQRRSSEMNALGEKLQKRFYSTQIGNTADVLFEEEVMDLPQCYRGYTSNYIPVLLHTQGEVLGKIVPVKLIGVVQDGMLGEVMKDEE